MELTADMQFNLWVRATSDILLHEIDENFTLWIMSKISKLWILVSFLIMKAVQCGSLSLIDQGLLFMNIGFLKIVQKYIN